MLCQSMSISICLSWDKVFRSFQIPGGSSVWFQNYGLVLLSRSSGRHLTRGLANRRHEPFQFCQFFEIPGMNVWICCNLNAAMASHSSIFRKQTCPNTESTSISSQTHNPIQHHPGLPLSDSELSWKHNTGWSLLSCCYQLFQINLQHHFPHHNADSYDLHATTTRQKQPRRSRQHWSAWNITTWIPRGDEQWNPRILLSSFSENVLEPSSTEMPLMQDDYDPCSVLRRHKLCRCLFRKPARQADNWQESDWLHTSIW